MFNCRSATSAVMLVAAGNIAAFLVGVPAQRMQHSNSGIQKQPLGNGFGRHACDLACGSVDRSMTFGSRSKVLDPLVADNLQLQHRTAGPVSHVK